MTKNDVKSFVKTHKDDIIFYISTILFMIGFYLGNPIVEIFLFIGLIIIYTKIFRVLSDEDDKDYFRVSVFGAFLVLTFTVMMLILFTSYSQTKIIKVQKTPLVNVRYIDNYKIIYGPKQRKEIRLGETEYYKFQALKCNIEKVQTESIKFKFHITSVDYKCIK